MNRALMAMLSTHLCVAIATNAVTTSPYVCCTQAQQTTAEQKVCGVSNNAIINSSLTTEWWSSKMPDSPRHCQSYRPALGNRNGQSQVIVLPGFVFPSALTERPMARPSRMACTRTPSMTRTGDTRSHRNQPELLRGWPHAGSQVWAADHCDGVLQSNSSRFRRSFADL